MRLSGTVRWFYENDTIIYVGGKHYEGKSAKTEDA